MDGVAAAPPPGGITISRSNLLLVEGPEDQRFWRSLLHDRRGDVQVEQTEGRDNLLRLLPGLVRTPGFGQVRWLGIVQDADADADATFRRICGALRRASLPVPRRPWTAMESALAVVAIVLPDGVSPGDLETLLWQGLQTLPAAACVNDYVQCLEANNLAPQRASKTRVYAYLASLPHPEQRLGHAVLAHQVPREKLEEILSLIPTQ